MAWMAMVVRRKSTSLTLRKRTAERRGPSLSPSEASSSSSSACRRTLRQRDLCTGGASATVLTAATRGAATLASGLAVVTMAGVTRLWTTRATANIGCDGGRVARDAALAQRKFCGQQSRATSANVLIDVHSRCTPNDACMARHRRFSPPSRPTSPLPPWPTPRPAGGPSTGSRLAGRAPGHSAGCSRRAASTGETIRPPARCRRGLKALPNEVLQPVDSMLQCRAIYKEEGNQRTESQLHVRKTWQACGQHANGPEWPKQSPGIT